MLGTGGWPARVVSGIGAAGGAWSLGRIGTSWSRPWAPMSIAALLVWLPLPLIGLMQRIGAVMLSGAPAQFGDLLPGWLLGLVGPAVLLLAAGLLVRLLLLRRATSAAPHYPT
jgi:hypothetical protein